MATPKRKQQQKVKQEQKRARKADPAKEVKTSEPAVQNPDERCYFSEHEDLLEDADECEGKVDFCNGCREFICEEHDRNTALMGEHDVEDHLVYIEDME